MCYKYVEHTFSFQSCYSRIIINFRQVGMGVVGTLIVQLWFQKVIFLSLKQLGLINYMGHSASMVMLQLRI